MAGFDGGCVFGTNVDFTGNSESVGIPQVTANGQLLIGSAVAPNIRVATLTAGNGVTITNGAGTIQIAANAFPITWSDQSANFPAVANNGYFATAAITATLPAGALQGNTISFAVDTTSALTITANAGQFIRIGTVVSAAAGTAVSTARGDSVTLVFRASDTTWISVGGPQGVWTVT
jgi:hypothetical protein